MKEQLSQLITAIKSNQATFSEVLAFIDERYHHHPTGFKNGSVSNEASQNQGSAKVFAFAQINNLDEQETLTLFAEHYQAVLASPEGVDHQNIRQFMKNGWDGVYFEGVVLTLK